MASLDLLPDEIGLGIDQKKKEPKNSPGGWPKRAGGGLGNLFESSPIRVFRRHKVKRRIGSVSAGEAGLRDSEG